MKTRAYAKINLSLNITGTREDGYHTLDSIFLPIDFYDVVELIPNETMEFHCNKPYIQYNESNTIYKAIELMKKEFNIQDNFIINLEKYIPTQAGLAGGSSDGAAVIRLINKNYHLNLSPEKIKELCLNIGADVLFTYYSRPARVQGIGEDVRFIDVKKDYSILLIKPRYGVSTKECFKIMNLDTCPHPDMDQLEDALRSANSFISYLGNSMEPAAISLVKDIARCKSKLIECGAPFALMSGSGSTIFTISEDEKEILSLAKKMKELGFYTRTTKLLKK